MGHHSFVHKELLNSELNYDFEQNWLLSTKRWGIRPSLLGLLITIRSRWSSVYIEWAVTVQWQTRDALTDWTWLCQFVYIYAYSINMINMKVDYFLPKYTKT